MRVAIHSDAAKFVTWGVARANHCWSVVPQALARHAVVSWVVDAEAVDRWVQRPADGAPEELSDGQDAEFCTGFLRPWSQICSSWEVDDDLNVES